MDEDQYGSRIDWWTPISSGFVVEFARLLTDADMDLKLYLWVLDLDEDEAVPYYMCFTWHEWNGYKNVNSIHVQFCEYNVNPPESYESHTSCTVENSAWVQLVKESSIFPQELTHYVIFTVTAAIEILSSQEPTIEKLSEAEAAALCLCKQTRIKSRSIRISRPAEG